MLNHFVIEYACYMMQYKVKLLKYQYLLLVTKTVLKLYSTGISLYMYTHTFASRHTRAHSSRRSYLDHTSSTSHHKRCMIEKTFFWQVYFICDVMYHDDL